MQEQNGYVSGHGPGLGEMPPRPHGEKQERGAFVHYTLKLTYGVTAALTLCQFEFAQAMQDRVDNYFRRLKM